MSTALRNVIVLPKAQKPSPVWENLLKKLEIKHLPTISGANGLLSKWDTGKLLRGIGYAIIDARVSQGAKNPCDLKTTDKILAITQAVINLLPAKEVLSSDELGDLVEEVIGDHGEHLGAKAFILFRAMKGAHRHKAHSLHVIRRNNNVAPWMPEKIELAVRKAFIAMELDSAPAENITAAIVSKIAELGVTEIHIEAVQDIVIDTIKEQGYTAVAETYSQYRKRRATERTQRDKNLMDSNPALITTELMKRIEFASSNLSMPATKEEVARVLIKSLSENFTSAETRTATILNAKTLVEKDPAYALFAARILLSYIYEEALNWKVTDGLDTLKQAHQEAFKAYIPKGIDLKRLNPELAKFNLEFLAERLDPMADLELDILAAQTLYDRYLIHENKKRMECPQIFWMRVAMGLALGEKENTNEMAASFYELYKAKRFCSSTPTLFNAGTAHSQLSSCYLYVIQDNIESIMYRGIAENGFLSKWAGGLGGSWTKVRGKGGYIKGTNGESQGVIPFLKMHNDQLVAVNQCWDGETPIITAQGIKPISKVTTADLVLTEDGEFSPVKEALKFEQNGKPMLKIKAKHTEEMSVTSEHPLWAITDVPMEQSAKRTYTQLNAGKKKMDWVEPKALKAGDYLGTRIPTESKDITSFTEDDALFYGLMLGNGHIEDKQGFKEAGFTDAKETPFGEEGIQFIKEYLKKNGIHSWENTIHGNTTTIHWSWKNGVGGLKREDLYNEKNEKHIPGRFLLLPRHKAIKMAKGLILSDGGVYREDEIWFYTSSLPLARGFKYLMLKNGTPTYITKAGEKKEHTSFRNNGSTVTFPKTTLGYNIAVPATKVIAQELGVTPLTKANWLSHNGFIFTRIKSIKDTKPVETVYDLIIDGPASYCTTDVLAHNGGKRKGSGCAYLETWHNDIEEFLQLRKNTGDDRRRCHDMNTANWIPDLFMERIEKGENWTLFRSNEVADLHETYGAAFKKKYEAYEKQASEGKIYGKTISARGLWKLMLESIFETGHPWITFKDPCNVRSPQDHVGVVHSSNLCTEITLNTSNEETAVCFPAGTKILTDRGQANIETCHNANVLSPFADDGIKKPKAKNGEIYLKPEQSYQKATLINAGEKPTIKIETSCGNPIVATAEHPFLVYLKYGDKSANKEKTFVWKKAQDLKPGDRIHAPWTDSVHEESETWSDDYLCAGWMLGDGWCTDQSAGLVFGPDDTTAKEFVQPKVIKWYNKLPRDPQNRQECPSGYTQPNGVSCWGTQNKGFMDMLETSFGFSKAHAPLKQIPCKVWNLNTTEKRSFLAGLFSADGCAQPDGSIELSSASLKLLEETQLLLKEFGIHGRITWFYVKIRDRWQGAIRIGHPESCQNFAKHIGFKLNPTRQTEMESYIKKANPRNSNGVQFYKVKSIKDNGVLPVYNLEVKETRNFIANGMVVHNCNLGSINLSRHISDTGDINWDMLRDTIRIAVRMLDNVIDINFYPTEAAKLANTRHRPIGMGIMGLQDALHKRNIPFASQRAVEFNDHIMEFIAFHAYLSSSRLAKERGAYSTFEGSKWSRDILPQDTIALLEQERSKSTGVPLGGKLNWTEVRESIKKYGMRNSNVLAIAPTATISNITGCTPCIEPDYKHLFVKTNMSGDFTVINKYLVNKLKEFGLWDDAMLDDLKYYDGELSKITRIPDEIKEQFATAFEIEQNWLVEAAARRGKWIDMAQSLNLFLASPNPKVLSDLYRHLHLRGLKTSYYLRTQSASSIEKATLEVRAKQVIEEPNCESCQ